ncbi:hypothetical protein HDV06_001821 [Boothiomyces sp. JEL0866]|nr:hypothetical protein HDV06_001821 [Boothiomyces sp. JEL0866]
MNHTYESELRISSYFSGIKPPKSFTNNEVSARRFCSKPRLSSPDYIHKISLIEEALQQRSILERHFSSFDSVFSIFDSELKKRLEYFNDHIDRPLVVRKDQRKKTKKHRRALALAKKLKKQKSDEKLPVKIPITESSSQKSFTINDAEEKNVDSDSELSMVERLSQCSDPQLRTELESDTETQNSKENIDTESLSMIERLTLSSPSLLEKIE